ncbi:MAG: hypothetical protein ACLVI9_00810 [Anaerostipes hadrus]
MHELAKITGIRSNRRNRDESLCSEKNLFNTILDKRIDVELRLDDEEQ